MRTILLISPYWREQHRWMMSTVQLAELWQRLGYRVVVACMGNPQGVEEVSETLSIHRRKDWFFPDPWNYGIAPGFSTYVLDLAERVHPQIVVINKPMFWTALALMPLSRRGHKVVLLTDVLVGYTWWPRSVVPRIAAFAGGRTIGALILRRAHRVVLFYPQPESLLNRFGLTKKAAVIPTGVDPEVYRSRDEANTTLTITYVGRVESNKGIDDYLAAAVPLRSQFPVLKIRVVGPHRSGHPLVRQYSREVEFTGYRPDVPKVLAETSIFVLASRDEGLSNALMEAMASGCACVASDAGGNPYLIEDGVSGLLFPRKDRDALRASLRRLLDDQKFRHDLGMNARARIEKHFNWRHLGTRWKELFETSST